MNELPKDLLKILHASGIEITERRTIDHGTQYRLHSAKDKAVLNVYSTGRVSVGGKASGLKDLLEGWRGSRKGSGSTSRKPSAAGKAAARRSPVSAAPRVGTDEAGKGDYFGSMVVAGVRITVGEQARSLESEGVRDSKALSPGQASRLAGEIMATVGEENIAVISLPPPEYEARRKAAGSVSRLLGELHAEIIHDLCAGTELAVVDAFGPESLVKVHLPPDLKLEMRPRAEDDVAVAAASILARARFLEDLAELSGSLGFELPRGATHVMEAARRVAREGGESALARVAKTHFVTTKRVLESL